MPRSDTTALHEAIQGASADIQLEELLLPSVRQVGVQERLFIHDPQIATMPAGRFEFGDFFEELTAIVTGATRMHTAAKRLCPDLVRGSAGSNTGRKTGSTYIECKSVGERRQPIVFRNHITRYGRFLSQNRRNQILYVFWQHRAAPSYPIRREALREQMASAVEALVVVPFPALLAFLAGRQSRPIHYTNNRVLEAYRLPWGEFRNRFMTGQPTVCMGATVYGQTVGAFSVFGGEHLRA